jgi:hypothetical protein
VADELRDDEVTFAGKLFRAAERLERENAAQAAAAGNPQKAEVHEIEAGSNKGVADDLEADD